MTGRCSRKKITSSRSTIGKIEEALECMIHRLGERVPLGGGSSGIEGIKSHIPCIIGQEIKICKCTTGRGKKSLRGLQVGNILLLPRQLRQDGKRSGRIERGITPMPELPLRINLIFEPSERSGVSTQIAGYPMGLQGNTRAIKSEGHNRHVRYYRHNRTGELREMWT